MSDLPRDEPPGFADEPADQEHEADRLSRGELAGEYAAQGAAEGCAGCALDGCALPLLGLAGMLVARRIVRTP